MKKKFTLFNLKSIFKNSSNPQTSNKCSVEFNVEQSESRHLRKIESMLDWLSVKCNDDGVRLCGIEKISYSGYKHYICFLLEPEQMYNTETRTSYTISGYSDVNDPPRLVYQAHIEQIIPNEAVVFSQDTHFRYSNKLELVDQCIPDETYRHQGIGTYAIDIIKKIAKELHCKEIYGKKEPCDNIEDQEGALAELTSFYRKCGFEQSEDSRNIRLKLQ